MIKKTFLSLIVASFLFSCNSSNEKKTYENEVDTEVVEEIIEEEQNTSEVVEDIIEEEQDISYEEEPSMAEIMLNLEASIVQSRAELNRVYDSIVLIYAKDKELLKLLKKSSDLYEEFMTVQMDARFYDKYEEGSGYTSNICLFVAKKPLIEYRTKMLREWLVGYDQGDICGGSLKSKDELRKK